MIDRSTKELQKTCLPEILNDQITKISYNISFRVIQTSNLKCKGLTHAKQAIIIKNNPPYSSNNW
ncbi:MAG: hypothetical protein ACW99Q_11315, partial [Candidatus Kariarchaeaceae archaeon]